MVFRNVKLSGLVAAVLCSVLLGCDSASKEAGTLDPGIGKGPMGDATKSSGAGKVEGGKIKADEPAK